MGVGSNLRIQEKLLTLWLGSQKYIFDQNDDRDSKFVYKI